jgi:lipopolysaccharide/colanic/teichoic acid biosynthesis glycosyltransferase
MGAVYLADLLIPIAAFAIAYELRYGAVPYADSLGEIFLRAELQFTLLAATAAHVFMMRLAGIYDLHRTRLLLDTVLRLVTVCTLTTFVFVIVGHGRLPVFFSRYLLGYLWIFLTLLTLAGKLAAQIAILAMLCVGIGVKKVLIVGSTETSRRLLRTLRQHPELGYRPIGLLFRGGGSTRFEETLSPEATSGSLSEMLRRVLSIAPDLVMVATSTHQNEQLRNLIAECTAHNIEVRLVPEFHEIYSARLIVDHIGAVPMVHLRTLKAPLFSAVTKRMTDFGVALSMMPVLALATLPLISKARQRGVPVLVTGTRIGLGGNPFHMYAFNPALWPECRYQARGGYLRLPAYLVLLPQFLNVLRGEMSLVGPRAAEPGRATHFSSWERRMLAVRPGLMGYVAVNELVPKEQTAEQMSWDVSYVDQLSFAFDISCLITNVLDLLRRRGAAGAYAG